MLQILLIEDDSNLMDKLTFLLEGTAGVTISTAKNFNEACQLLESNTKTNLIVADYRCGDTPEVEKFKSQTVFIDAIICVDDITDSNAGKGWRCIDKIPRLNIASSLKSSIDKILNNMEYSERLKFCRIKTSILLETSPLHCDIYAKLSEVKYLKIFLAGDTFDSEDFNKYTRQKKLDYLYLREDDCGVFIKKYVSQIDQLMKKVAPPTHEQLNSMNITAYESVQELTNVLGFTKEVQQLAKSHVQMTVQFMDRKPNLSKLLGKLKMQKGKYMADHAYLLSYIACGISTHMDWGSEATYFKLSLAAFLHDIAINDTKLAACSTIEEASSLGFDEKMIELFRNHPNIAADYARKMSEIPPDVDMIIQQHHELPSGKGFPRGLTANYIAPLTTIFIVAHDMVKQVFFPPPEGFSIAQYLTGAQEKFQHSSFKKVLSAVKKMELKL